MAKSFYIETYGCQMNVADSEVVAAILRTTDADYTDDINKADIILLNTCSIRDNAEQRVQHRLQELAGGKHGKRRMIGVIGCMAERMGEQLLRDYKVDFVAGPDAYLDLPNLIAQCEQGHQAINVQLSTTETYADVLPARLGKQISGFVSIMRGCNNFCSYCVVPYTRGRERSRDVQSILSEVRDLQTRGYKEVTLLGQNVNSYCWQPAADQIVNGKYPNRQYCRQPEHLQVYPLTRAERQQQDPQTHEPQIHTRVVSRAHCCHTAYCARRNNRNGRVLRIS